MYISKNEFKWSVMHNYLSRGVKGHCSHQLWVQSQMCHAYSPELSLVETSFSLQSLVKKHLPFLANAVTFLANALQKDSHEQ